MRSTKFKTKTEKGITLVALIITIVILLILAVVAINSIQSDGIIDKAELATQKYNQSVRNEADILQNYLEYIDKNSGGKIEDSSDKVDAIGEIDDKNNITLYGDLLAGIYTLKYENSSGIMNEYEKICSLEITDSNEDVVYSGFIEQNCAPVGSTAIGVYNTSNERVGHIDLPKTMLPDLGNKLYSFGALSDIHLKNNIYGSDESNSLADYQRALTFFKNNNADLVGVSGDIVALNRKTGDNITSAHNEWVSELELFKEYSERYFSGKPVYATIGNHEANPNGYYIAINNDNKDTEGLNIKIVADGYDGTKTAEEVYKEIVDSEINYVVEHNDDVFIFFSMYYWYYAKFNRDEDVSWLQTQLETYKDKRVFLFFHLPLHNTFEFTVGSAGGFPSASNGFPSNYLMGQLVQQYKNVVWFSGHTHYDFTLQETYEKTNIYQMGDSMTMVHCPSTTSPRLPTEDGNYVNNHEGSQGYIIDVYENKIVVKGIDFTLGQEGKIVPVAHYVFDT